MSNFAGAKQFYQNPLISYFNQYSSEFTPPTLKQQLSVDKSYLQPSFTISLLPRIKVFKKIQEDIDRIFHAKTGLPVGAIDYWTTQLTFYQASVHLSNWYPIGGAQKDFKYFVDNYRMIPDLEDNLKFIVTTNSRDLLNFTSKVGGVKNMPLGVNEIGAAAVYSPKLSWSVGKGLVQNIKVDGKIYKAFEIRTPGVRILSSKYYQLPLIELRTTVPEIKVYIEMNSGSPNVNDGNGPMFYDRNDPYRLVQRIIDTRRNMQFFQSEMSVYQGAIIPEVLLIREEDTKHLDGFQYRNQLGTRIVKGFTQETKIHMGAGGVGLSSFGEAKSQPALCESFSTKPLLEVNRPFLMWISHELVRYPLFVGYFNTDSWLS